MNPQTCKTFSQLLEGFVIEASSAMGMVSSDPGGSDVVKYLHSKMGLSHDLEYSPIDKISWNDLKGRSAGNWVLIKGVNGTGAIKAVSDSYEAVASTGGSVESYNDSKGGRILDFLKDQIGKPQKFFMARGTSDVRSKQQKRASAKDGVGPKEVDRETLVKKFRPLWVRAMNSAIADIKGHIANMIKNDAFGKAAKKIKYIEALQSGVEDLEAGQSDTPSYLREAVQTAIYMAASHYYPEQTGSINRGYGGSYSPQFHEGPRLLLKDISSGDTKKLGTVLGFFKRTLISG